MGLGSIWMKSVYKDKAVQVVRLKKDVLLNWRK